jgi:hypothetical protein
VHIGVKNEFSLFNFLFFAKQQNCKELNLYLGKKHEKVETFDQTNK